MQNVSVPFPTVYERTLFMLQLSLEAKLRSSHLVLRSGVVQLGDNRIYYPSLKVNIGPNAKPAGPHDLLTGDGLELEMGDHILLMNEPTVVYSSPFDVVSVNQLALLMNRKLDVEVQFEDLEARFKYDGESSFIELKQGGLALAAIFPVPDLRINRYINPKSQEEEARLDELIKAIAVRSIQKLVDKAKGRS